MMLKDICMKEESIFNVELKNFYKEDLEEQIIFQISKDLNLSLDDAMDKYYSSSFASMVERGENGIQYLSLRVLSDMFLEQMK